MTDLNIFYFVFGAFTLSVCGVIVYKTIMTFMETKSGTQKTTRKVHSLLKQGKNPKEYFERNYRSMTDDEEFAVYMATSGKDILEQLKD